MSLKIRWLISIIFILCFILVTPLIILYAAGYKLNPANISFQKTGMFILDTAPRGAKIFINNKPQQNLFKKISARQPSAITTPAKIKNLLPGKYDIKLELAGYWPWQKKLSIFPGAATYAEDIFLFKQNLPILIYGTSTTGALLSPNRTRLAILSASQLILFDLNNEQKQSAAGQINLPKLSWSADSQKIISADTIFNANNLSDKINLDSLARLGATKFFWANNKIYYQLQNTINTYNPTTKLSQTIINGQKIDNYLVKDDYLYLISNLKQFTALNIFKISSNEFLGNINLPLSLNYNFINIDQKIINLYDQNQQLLYLIDPQAALLSPTIKTIANIKYTYWINDTKLLYANDWEIWLNDLTNSQKILITRISASIKGLAWHPSNNYIIYWTDKTINTIELDEREKRNTTELVKFDQISSLALNSPGNLLYFLAKIGSQAGFYKLAIQ